MTPLARSLFCIALALLLVPPAEGKGTARDLVLDAKLREICQEVPNSTTLICDPESFEPYGHHEVIDLRVVGAPCSTLYRLRVDDREVPEATAAVRGLGEVEGMLVGLLPAPAALGVVPLEEVSITERSFADLLGRMQTLEGVEELEAEIEEEARLLAGGLEGLERGEKEYQDLICPMIRLPGLCDGWTPPPTDSKQDDPRCCPVDDGTLPGLTHRLRTLCQEIEDVPNDRSCDAFVDRFDAVERLVAKTRAYRQRIETSPVASYPGRMIGLADALDLRLDLFAGKLRRTEAAAKIAEGFLAARDRDGLPVQRSEVFLQYLQRLRTSHASEEIAPGTLQALAEDFARVALSGRPRGLVEKLGGLKVRAAELCGTGLEDWCEGPKTPPGTRPAEPATVAGLRASLDRLKTTVRDANRVFEAEVRTANVALKDALEALADLDRRLGRDEDLANLGAWTTNRKIKVAIFEKSGFKVPDLSSLDQLRLPAGALSEVVDEPPAADEGFIQVDTATFEVHKLYRFNVGIGVAATGLGEREFGVRSVPRLDDDGDPVLDDDGDPVLDPVVVETGSDGSDVRFPLLITYYLGGPLDAFPGETASYTNWGVSLGFDLEEPDENLFLGASYQPTLGIQLVGGFHYGRRTALEDGIDQGDILPAGTEDAPTRREWAWEPFVGVTFDAGVFRRLLQGAS